MLHFVINEVPNFTSSINNNTNDVFTYFQQVEFDTSSPIFFNVHSSLILIKILVTFGPFSRFRIKLDQIPYMQKIIITSERNAYNDMNFGQGAKLDKIKTVKRNLYYGSKVWCHFWLSESIGFGGLLEGSIPEYLQKMSLLYEKAVILPKPTVALKNHQ